MNRFEVIRVYDNDGNTLDRALNAIGDEQFILFIGETRTPGGTSYYTIVVENTTVFEDVRDSEQLDIVVDAVDDDSKEL